MEKVYNDLFYRGHRAKYENIIGSFMGLFAAGFGNFMQRKPVHSRIYRYPAFAAGGWFLGSLVYTWHHKRVVEHEMAIWDYVERHPEDFPELKPKKFTEVLHTWHPIR